MSRVDLVIVEGFKSEPHRKIEVHRLAGLAGQLNIRTAPGLMA